MEDVMNGASGTDVTLQAGNGPDVTTGNPPAQDTNTGITANPNQANTPSGGAQIPPEIANSQFYKDAVKGMNEAQRATAEYRKAIGDLPPEQAAQAIEAARYIAQNPSQALVELAQRVGPQEAIRLLVQNPAQSVNVPQQPQMNQADFSQFGPEAQQFAQTLMQAIEQKFAPNNQFIEQQRKDVLINQAKVGIDEAVKYAGQVDNNKVWDYMANSRLNPQDAGWAVIQSAGGMQKFVENIKQQTLAEIANKANLNRANVSSTLTNNGAQATQTPNFTNPDDAFGLIAQGINSRLGT